MLPILIFQHVDCEGPGYLGEFLARQAAPFRVVRIDRGEAVPASLEDVGGMALMGGPMSVNDDLPWIAHEVALIRAALEAGLPVLGHCLGGQLIAAALGARVSRNPVREIGWHEVHRSPDAAAGTDTAEAKRSARLLDALPERFEAFHWHGETFTIPDGAAAVLASVHCTHQAFVKGSALALQFHVEVTAEMVEAWARAYREELAATDVPSIQSAPAMMADIDGRLARLHRIADVFYEFWLSGLK